MILRGRKLNLKMLFYERYEYDKKRDIYIGKGDIISGDAKSYLSSVEYNENAIFMLGIEKKGIDIVFNRNNLYDSFKKTEKFYKDLFNENYETMLMEHLTPFLGPVGRNDFVRKGDNYICYEFHFDEEWFKKECERLIALKENFHRYHGFSYKSQELPIQFLNLLYREKYSMDLSDIKTLQRMGRIQKNIISKILSNKEISDDEKGILNKFDNASRKALRAFLLGNPLTSDERKKLNKMRKNHNQGAYEISINVNAKRDKKTRSDFLNAINDVMHNVRTITEWNDEIQNFITKQVPINCFGHYALFALQTLKINQAYYNCESCGEVEFFNHKSTKICERCKAAKRQRKQNIKKDILKGFSLNEILSNRTRMKKEEIYEYYSELKKELTE